MSEADCLTMNIWAPDTGTRRKPVLLFAHGGSFCHGAGSEPDLSGAEIAAAGDVVVATINYRLGVLGFLDFSFLDEDFQPNCGVSDLVQALKWIRANAEAFGGDPENITLFGQSAGAIMTSMLPVMPDAASLVQRGICMSASPTTLHSKRNAQILARQYMEVAGLTKDSLVSTDAAELAARQKEFRAACGLGAGTFMPEVDGVLVRDHPIAAAARGDAIPVPLLLGTCREEMSLLFVKPVADVLEISGILDAGTDAEPPGMNERIASGYDMFGKRGPAILMSDLVFRMGSVWLAEALSAHTDVWMYRFDFETAAMRVSGMHTFHSCDIPFVFGNHECLKPRLMFLFSPLRSGIRRVTREMRQDFLAFARGEQLPWDACSGEYTPARCYGTPSTVEQAVPQDIKDRYKGSMFRKRSFAGEDNNMRTG